MASLEKLAVLIGMQTEDDEGTQKTISELLGMGHSQHALVCFIATNEMPTHSPQQTPCTNSLEPDIMSNIVVFFTVTGGRLPSLTGICFLIRLTAAGVLKNTQISNAWNALTDNMDPVRFFLSGPSLLKTFLLAVNHAYYPEDSWKQFTALILSKTDSYFHQMVTNIFDTAIYAQIGEGGNVEIVCD
jgi:hypothetical protein